MKLIPMTDFAIEHGKNLNTFSKDVKSKVFESIMNYAKFLKQPLELWMFVPCDEEGSVLEKPKKWMFNSYFDYQEELTIYNKAKSRVLFEGFEYKNGKIGFPSLYHPTDKFTELFINERTVEDMLGDMFENKLTPTAIKQLGL